ncbi:hypothetical protein P7C70_g4455, partial [Phenoliferia sp. Uapishka_3]
MRLPASTRGTDMLPSPRFVVASFSALFTLGPKATSIKFLPHHLLFLQAIARYGIQNIQEGFMFCHGGKGGRLMRKMNAFDKCADDANSTQVPTLDQLGDLMYTAEVRVGSPHVSLELDFDTGSADTWCLSSEMKHLHSIKRKHVVFDPRKSETHKKEKGTWTIHYGDGTSARGNICEDDISIGGLKVHSQTVQCAEEVSQSFLNVGSDGESFTSSQLLDVCLTPV